jgi:hypothetical protein
MADIPGTSASHSEGGTPLKLQVWWNYRFLHQQRAGFRRY